MKELFQEECLICGGKNIHDLKKFEKHQLLKCSSCGFVFMKKIPSFEELKAYYSVYAYEYEKEISEATKMSIVDLLDSFEKYRVNNKMLDIGCGEGWILGLAKKRGWDVFGTEISQKAIEICNRKGIKIYPGVLAPENVDEKNFDVIISSETIEHINNPVKEVCGMNSLLRTGGLHYITTPNFNSYLRRFLGADYDIISYPEHLSYYTKSTLNKLLSQSNFSKVKLLTTGISITRYQSSKKNGNSVLPVHSNPDEKLRNRITKSSSLLFIKRIVNSVLSLLGIGMTLKAYYIKRK